VPRADNLTTFMCLNLLEPSGPVHIALPLECSMEFACEKVACDAVYSIRYITLLMETAGSSETSIYVYPTA
jgi:hypothetical protein